MSLQSFLASISASFSGSADPDIEQPGATILRRLNELNETIALGMPSLPSVNARYGQADQDETFRR
jgi:hypothetical protein